MNKPQTIADYLMMGQNDWNRYLPEYLKFLVPADPNAPGYSRPQSQEEIRTNSANYIYNGGGNNPQSLQYQYDLQKKGLPQKKLRDYVDKINNNGQGTMLRPELYQQTQQPTIQSQLQQEQLNTGSLSNAELKQNKYQSGTDPYIIQNLQQHGYNPQQISDYLQTEHSKTQTTDPYEELLKQEYTKALNRGSYDYNPERAMAIAQKLSGISQQKQLKETDLLKLKYDMEKNKVAGQNKIDIEKYKADATIKAAEAKATGGGKILPSGKVSELSDLRSGMNLLNGFSNTIDSLKDKNFFNPLTGGIYVEGKSRLGDADAKDYLSQITLIKQIIGKGLEGGVLRKEDTAKYNAILGSTGATKEQLKQIGKSINKTLQEKLDQLLEDYEMAGYDVTNFSNDTNTNANNVNKEYNFNSIDELNKTPNIPVGTEVTINGKKFRVK